MSEHTTTAAAALFLAVPIVHKLLQTSSSHKSQQLSLKNKTNKPTDIPYFQKSKVVAATTSLANNNAAVKAEAVVTNVQSSPRSSSDKLVPSTVVVSVEDQLIRSSLSWSKVSLFVMLLG